MRRLLPLLIPCKLLFKLRFLVVSSSLFPSSATVICCMHFGDLMRSVGWVAPILTAVAIFIHDIGESGSARAESKAPAKKSAAASTISSHWNHNGSAVSLVSEGKKQKFFYDAPRVGLLDAGVKPGTLLFDGQRSGQNFEGLAYQFYRTCKAHGFLVTGSTSDDRKTITLKGKAPLLDMNCNVTGSRDDVLIFTRSEERRVGKECRL